MMFILMLARRYPVAQANLQQGKLYEPLGRELAGLRLGIIGFGASGIELAKRAKGFGLRLSAIDVRTVCADEVQTFGLEFVGKPDDLHLNRETHHIIDARRLALMKPDAFLVNVARGALVDEAALEGALLAGKLGSAGLDAFSQEPPAISAPLFRLPNVIAMPHTAGTTDGTSRKRAQCCADNVDRIAAGLEPLYRVA